jgi:hypothetical protein
MKGDYRTPGLGWASGRIVRRTGGHGMTLVAGPCVGGFSLTAQLNLLAFLGVPLNNHDLAGAHQQCEHGDAGDLPSMMQRISDDRSPIRRTLDRLHVGAAEVSFYQRSEQANEQQLSRSRRSEQQPGARRSAAGSAVPPGKVLHRTPRPEAELFATKALRPRAGSSSTRGRRLTAA